MKICCASIFKDDSELLMAKQMLASFMPYCSGLAVALTGISGKHTKLKKLITSYGGAYAVTSPQTHPALYSQDSDGSFFFSNFAAARNVSFALADTMEAEWYTWADVDDQLVGGKDLERVATQAQKDSLDMVFFTYWYGLNVHEDGSFSEKDVMIDHLRERLIRPKMFHWISRLHEVCVPNDGTYQSKNSAFEWNRKAHQETVWAHVTEPSRVMEALTRNTKILELQVREEQRKDPRTLGYLAKTYFDLKTPQADILAEQLIEEYQELSGWREERANMYVYLAQIWMRRGNHQKAVEVLHKALEMFPKHHLIYLHLSKEYGELGMWEEAEFYLDMVLKMDPPKSRTTIGNPLEIKYMAASLKFNQCIRRQDLPGAIEWMKIRNTITGMPDDGMIQTLEEAKTLNDAAQDVMKYAKWLKDQGHTKEITKLLDALAPEFTNEPFVQYLANEYAEPKTWDEKSIVYYASWGGQGIAEWTPESLKNGLGGSETAVVELARHWAKCGYHVTVYTDVGEYAGIYEGVQYKHWSKMNWNDTFNILILWRSPHLLSKDIKAKKLYMDLHDVASQLDWTEARMNRVDGVFFKSAYHRSMLPKLPDTKAHVVSNGVTV